MNHACQSPQTLSELLVEAASFVSMAPDNDIVTRLEALQRVLSTSPVASADVEQEILSLREVARRRAARTTRPG
jgi:hypothetical protein